MKRTSASILILALLSGCAGSYRPVVDRAPVSRGSYELDLADCQNLAQTEAASAADGAIVGAIFGALLGAALGGNRDVQRYGAVVGGLHGAAATDRGQVQIVAGCMRGRGWTVL